MMKVIVTTMQISHCICPRFLIYVSIPLISPKHPPDINKISLIYPPKYIPQISPRYTSYIPQIYLSIVGKSVFDS